MSCLGMLFAVDHPVAQRLLAAKTSKERIAIVDELEAGWDPTKPHQWINEMDNSWDAIHQALGDSPPLDKFIFGGRFIERGKCAICLVTPEEAAAAAAAAEGKDQAWFRERFFREPRRFNARRPLSAFHWLNDRLCLPRPGNPDDEDHVEHAWSWFQDMPGFFARAAAAGKWVVVSVNW